MQPNVVDPRAVYRAEKAKRQSKQAVSPVAAKKPPGSEQGSQRRQGPVSSAAVRRWVERDGWSRARVTIAQPERLKNLLWRGIAEVTLSFGEQRPRAVLMASRIVGIPQPTLWQVLNGRTVVLATTLRRLRRLAPLGTSDTEWREIVYSRDLRAYERTIEHALEVYASGFGTRRPLQLLRPPARSALKEFERWAVGSGYHPARVLLALRHITAPLTFARRSLEARTLTAEAERQVVRLGIRRETILLGRAPRF